LKKPGLKCGFQYSPPPSAFPLFLLISSLGDFTKRKQTKISKELFKQSISYLLLVTAAVLIAATVVCITALALPIVAEDFPCWCLRPLLLACSRDWVRSAKRRLLYSHASLHARDVVKRFRLSLCTKEKLLQEILQEGALSEVEGERRGVKESSQCLIALSLAHCSPTLHSASVGCCFAGAKEVLAIAAVLLSCWRCAAAAPAAALF